MKDKAKDSIVNAMTVDVEDYFQVSAFEGAVDRGAWDSMACRVEANVDTILELFESHRVRGTFFTLGWVAERYPGTIRKIVGAGHELASHGWGHVRATTQNPEEFYQDVIRTKCVLEDISGISVKGYRAASYSIGAENLWAHDKLADAGYLYSSSIVPIKHDHYGMPGASRFPFRVADGRLLEIPVSTVRIGNKTINCGGGGWFRLFPYAFQHWALSSLNSKEGSPGMFYIHPWEIDPDQPRIDGVNWKSRFRHYLNLDKTYPRLEQLLRDFSWDRVDSVFLEAQEAEHDSKAA